MYTPVILGEIYIHSTLWSFPYVICIESVTVGRKTCNNVSLPNTNIKNRAMIRSACFFFFLLNLLVLNLCRLEVGFRSLFHKEGSGDRPTV